jgi:hypothetical protein
VYPFGVRRICAGQRHPKVVRTSLPSRLSPKCPSPHLTASHDLEEAVLDQQKSSATGPAKHHARRCDVWTFSAARPERGRGRRGRQRSLLVLWGRGRAPGRLDCRGAAGSWFGASPPVRPTGLDWCREAMFLGASVEAADQLTRRGQHDRSRPCLRSVCQAWKTASSVVVGSPT